MFLAKYLDMHDYCSVAAIIKRDLYQYSYSFD